MKKNLATLLCFFLILFAHAQEQFKKTAYKNDSVYVYPFPFYCWDYYANPFFELNNAGGYSREYRGLFLTSTPLPDGKWIAYFNDPHLNVPSELETTEVKTVVKTPQRVALEFSVSQGKLNGFAKAFNRAGKRAAEGNYKDGEKEGLWNIYSFNGKEIVERIEYTSGTINGSWESLEKGKPYARQHFKEGVMDGEQLLWYENGKIKESEGYKDGRLYGPFTQYYPNGKLSKQGTADGNLLRGWYREWSPKGILTSEFHHMDVDDNNWYPSLLKGMFTNSDGENELWDLNGPATLWWENGKLKNKSFYKYGVKIYGDTTYDKNGAISVIQKDSLVYRKDTVVVFIKREYNPGMHLKSYDYSWPDSVEISRLYDSQGRLAHESYTLGYSYKEHIFPVSPGEDSLRPQKAMIRVKEIDLRRPGIETYSWVYDPVAKKLVSSSHYLNGQLESTDLIEEGKTRIQKEYDQKGKLEKVTYSSPSIEYYSDPENVIKAKDWVESELENNDFDLMFQEDSVIYYSNGIPRNGKGKVNLKEDLYAIGVFQNGRKTGLWKVYKYNPPLSFLAKIENLFSPGILEWEINFVNNSTEGTVRNYDVCRFGYRMYGHHHPFRYLNLTQEYKNNKKEGISIEYDPYGDVLSRTNYHLELKDGKEVHYWENGKCKESCNYKKGQLDGCLKQWTIDSILTDENNYTNGIKDGIWKEWYENGIKKAEGSYEKGERKGLWIHYFENGQANAKVQFMTEIEVKKQIPTSPVLPLKYRTQIGYGNSGNGVLSYMPEATSLEENNAFVTYFYEGGQKAQEGYIANDKRAGTWTWWREDGSKEKEISYIPGLYIDGQADTLLFLGRYTSWHPSGGKVLEALIMSEDQKYDCSKEVFDKVQELYYLHGWDEKGTPVITDGNGYLKGYDIGNVVRSEGPVLSGIKNGPWLYRYASGNLFSMGTYEMGIKTGKWLEGDLTGIHTIENACYRNLSQAQLDRLMMKLEINEEWYKKGRCYKTIVHSNEQRYYYSKEQLHPFRSHRYRSDGSYSHHNYDRVRAVY